MEEVLKVANSLGAWLTAAPIVIIATVQAWLYYRQIHKAAEVVNISKQQLKVAFRTGMVTSIGPVVAIFIIMVGLMTVIGAPMAWMRLAVIGAAPTELTAATLGADAMGVKFGGEGYNLQVMAVSWWTMAVNGVGWLLLIGLFAHKLEIMREKVGGGDTKWLGILSTAAMIGVFGYLNSRNITTVSGPFVATVVGAVSMIALLQLAKKMPQIKEYTLGIAMLIGMFSAMLY